MLASAGSIRNDVGNGGASTGNDETPTQAIASDNGAITNDQLSDEPQAEAARPYTVVSRNIRGLSLHIDSVLASGNDVTALQETDVLECDVTWLTAKATAKGFTLVFAPTTAISKDGVTRRGRRAAILVKGPAIPKVLSSNDDPTYLAPGLTQYRPMA